MNRDGFFVWPAEVQAHAAAAGVLGIPLGEKDRPVAIAQIQLVRDLLSKSGGV